MIYQFKNIESKWRDYWKSNSTYKVSENSTKEKFYVLDMFPYPSGAGLHVGHPLGYIASDIFSRYKKLKGFNVLHPMGYDSFGLPAEQYAIQTGQHPELTTKINIERYRTQLDKLGFSYDWDREVRTSDSNYYRWTQWIFKRLYQSYFCLDENRAMSIDKLISIFETQGNKNVNASCDEDTFTFESHQWNEYSEQEKQKVLLKYRLAFLSDTWVNWCPQLGTVLANDEVKDGRSERGNHPVEQKKMRQWSLRITAYADRLLKDLDTLEWSESIKEIQKNWIGRSVGASLHFSLVKGDETIEVFTTRPDTIFGVSFMVIAPEHPLVSQLITEENKQKVENYIKESSLKSERDRQSDVKNITGVFTGSYVIHPFSNEKIPVWIADYVLASYGTGAVMAVPCGDQRDWDFANKFDLEIINIFKNVDVSKKANDNKDSIIDNSDFLSGLSVSDALKKSIEEIEKKGIGKKKINYRLRDAIFSRQRYWGEPFPVYYKDDIPYILEQDQFVELPPVDAYLPTEQGEPPLARAKKGDWNIFEGDRMEFNTMPGWAGSSWYFLRYMDPNNSNKLVSKEKSDYWGQVDLYIGGAEHAVGHLLYSRFWTKFLYDIDCISFQEPFKKMINQGMILGRSSFVYRINDTNTFVTFEKRKQYKTSRIHVDISLVDNDILDIERFKNWRTDFKDAEFILNDDNKYFCGFEVEKMSKSKYNVQTPDNLIESFGADTLRMYEMFLGPLEQFKPWDTKGINGVHNFLRKFWRLVHDDHNHFYVSDQEPSKKEWKVIHQTIKKVTDDIERYSFNTVVSALMICVNDLAELKCNKSQIISNFVVLLSPYAPHLSEEIWQLLGNKESVTKAKWPEFNEKYLVEDNFTYPVSFNGKMRFTLDLSANLNKEQIEKLVLEQEQTIKYLDGKEPKRIIVVPKKIVNIVC
jgi:leucyl-tRNA synthetase